MNKEIYFVMDYLTFLEVGEEFQKGYFYGDHYKKMKNFGSLQELEKFFRDVVGADMASDKELMTVL
jgi:hypothetical protein